MRYKRSAGFTLIELLISITILAFISMAIYQNTSQSFRLRENLQRDGEFYNSIDVALSVIRRDITHLYNPQLQSLPADVTKGIKPRKGEENKNLETNPYPQQPQQPQAAQPQEEVVTGTPLDFWSEPLNKYGIRYTRFTGAEDEMTFVASSHMRLFRDTQESEFSKIAYRLGEEKFSGGSGKKALIRIEDPLVFGEDDFSDKKETNTLLPNVKSIAFQYLDGEKDRWHTRWDTLSQEHQNIFPWVIEVKLEVYLPSAISTGKAVNEEKTFIVVQRFRPELPL